MNKNLKNQIEKKLDKLAELLDQIDEARIIVVHEPETWDSDTLYNLVENLQKALKLLENQTGKEKDAWGEPIILAEGLCALMNQYQEEEEDDE